MCTIIVQMDTNLYESMMAKNCYSALPNNIQPIHIRPVSIPGLQFWSHTVSRFPEPHWLSSDIHYHHLGIDNIP